MLRMRRAKRQRMDMVSLALSSDLSTLLETVNRSGDSEARRAPQHEALL